ncbi:hypothetical protein BDY24DRAFT_194262 [Mrakia frigida]|uniref:uncharacterized protein n=1 Tax=Mrakia frigida TaxID=29902 RepID=UPI003FCC1640
MAVPTAAYLVIVLGILVLGWGLATLIYFILRRRGIVPSLFASNSDFVRPAARPARFGFGGRNGFFAGGSPMGTGGGRGGLVAGGGRAPWQQFTQEWKPVLGEMPKLEERVLKEGGGEEEWKVSSTLFPRFAFVRYPTSFGSLLPAHQRSDTIPILSPTFGISILSHRSPFASQILQLRLLPDRPRVRDDFPPSLAPFLRRTATAHHSSGESGTAGEGGQRRTDEKGMGTSFKRRREGERSGLVMILRPLFSFFLQLGFRVRSFFLCTSVGPSWILFLVALGLLDFSGLVMVFSA